MITPKHGGPPFHQEMKTTFINIYLLLVSNMPMMQLKTNSLFRLHKNPNTLTIETGKKRKLKEQNSKEKTNIVHPQYIGIRRNLKCQHQLKRLISSKTTRLLQLIKLLHMPSLHIIILILE